MNYEQNLLMLIKAQLYEVVNLGRDLKNTIDVSIIGLHDRECIAIAPIGGYKVLASYLNGQYKGQYPIFMLYRATFNQQADMQSAIDKVNYWAEMLTGRTIEGDHVKVLAIKQLDHPVPLDPLSNKRNVIDIRTQIMIEYKTR